MNFDQNDINLSNNEFVEENIKKSSSNKNSLDIAKNIDNKNFLGLDLAKSYGLKSDSIKEIIPHKVGHINNTFIINMFDNNNIHGYKSFILQKINTYVFKNPVELMENIAMVSDYIRSKARLSSGNPDREVFRVIATNENKSYYLDTKNNYWRLYTNIENSYSVNKAKNPYQFYEAARAFGNFQNRLSTFDANKLHETIKNFHDTRLRYQNFLDVLERNSSSNRVKNAKAEIIFLQSHSKIVDYLTSKQENGVLPLRVTHNDTKLNNVLFDKNSERAIAVIDLDTVMPGLAVNDFGDAIRYGANAGAEDEKDLNKVYIDLDLYEAFTKGFLETAGPILTNEEKANLVWGAKLMTLECGMRFLTDYLENDIYFNIEYPEHNLIRAKSQFKLLSSMEENEKAMQNIIDKYI